MKREGLSAFIFGESCLWLLFYACTLGVAMSGDVTVKPESIDVGLSGGDERASDAGTEVVAETKPATRELVDTVTAATWNEALHHLGGSPSDSLPLWTKLASRILRAVADGERDPQLIKRFALDGLNAHDGFSKD
jgi:hypothetical protein